MANPEQGQRQFMWEVPPINGRETRGDNRIQGTLLLDVDGTLTIPDKDYAIYPGAIEAMADFLDGGGNIILSTGATRGRIERTVLSPLYCLLDTDGTGEKSKQLMQKIFLMPENGSALLLNRGVVVVENELVFDWYRIHELPVPNKQELVDILRQELITKVQGSKVFGDGEEQGPGREYILSWKGLTNTLKWKQYIEEEVVPLHPEVDWEKVGIKAARTTLDFIHADSGKTISADWALNQLSGLEGPVMGFGDLGDEFAAVVPTINVNVKKPNEFRRRGMPAMEICTWKPLTPDSFVIQKSGDTQIVRNIDSGNEIQVVRDENGQIIYSSVSVIRPDQVITEVKVPTEIYPVETKDDTQGMLKQGAGPATSWLIGHLVKVGHFST